MLAEESSMAGRASMGRASMGRQSRSTKVRGMTGVSYKFKQQMGGLIRKIEEAQPHYVRCIN